MVGGEVILHVSCQTLTVSHIPFLAQKIMTLLGIDYTTLGGPENCCGAFQWHMGEADYERQIATMTLGSFRRLKPVRVVSTCPDCDDSFQRHTKPQHTFQHTNIAELFAENLDKLRPLMKHPVNRRVAIHSHEDGKERSRDAECIRQLMQAVPGVEVVDAPKSLGLGGHCVVLTNTVKAEVTQAMFEEAKALGVDYLVVPYHGCYRQHCKQQLTYGIEVQHYLAVLAQALGIPYEEPFKQLRLLDDVDKAVEQLRPRIEKLGFKEAEVRDYVKAAIYV